MIKQIDFGDYFELSIM